MREDRVHQVFLGELTFASDHVALDELSYFCTHHVRAKQLSCFGIEDCFDQAFRLTQSNGFTVPDEWELADFQLFTGLLGFVFGQTNARDLRVAIGTAGHIPIIERVRLIDFAGDLFDTDDTLMASFVREPRAACEVTNRVEAFDARTTEAVHDDMSPVKLNAELFQTKAF